MQKSVNHNSRKVTLLSVVLIVIGLSGLYLIAKFQAPMGLATEYGQEIRIDKVILDANGMIKINVYSNGDVSANVYYMSGEWKSCGKVFLTKGYTLVQCNVAGKPSSVKIESNGKTVIKYIN